MTTLDDIPADTVIEMTIDLIRAFRSQGCDPRCHNCGEELTAGMKFKLAEFKQLHYYTGWDLKLAEKNAESADEMLCDTCTANDLREARILAWETNRNNALDRQNHRGNYQGYIRKHKL